MEFRFAKFDFALTLSSLIIGGGKNILTRISSGACFALLAALSLIDANVSIAADYPNRPVRLIVPYAAGGATDVTSRTIAPRLSEKWGQQILHGINARVSQLRITSLFDPSRLEVSLKEIYRILDAVSARDEEAAWRASTEHVANAAEAAPAILRKQKNRDMS